MYRNWVKIALILIYLVIIAGAVVRMTGSGMGCPDWPKCFGYYVPPTDVETLQWQPNRAFEKGHVIIVNEALQVATSNFTTSNAFNPSNWEQYTKHDYATFNVWHTWIEYINRLLGALSGIAILVMAVLSIWKWKRRKQITLLSWLSVFLIGFQGWLGATVVYSVLAPIRITIHMVMALVIVALLLYLLKISEENQQRYAIPTTLKNLFLFSLFLTLVQVVFGTQVRQFIDEQVKIVGYDAKASWLRDPTLSFYIHRSFSLLVFVLNGWLWYTNKMKGFRVPYVSMIFVLVVAEAVTGIAMYYFDFPMLSQPLHLVIAALLFGLQFYVILMVMSRDNVKKSYTKS